MKPMTAGLAAFAVLAATSAGAQPSAPMAHPTASPPEGRPALIVTIVVDQFSANLFNQWRPRFTGGLRRLTDQGIVYANGYQAQALTETCPGHATILTGVFPTGAGIPANDWIDTTTGEEVYCLAAPQNTIAGGRSDNGPVGPDNLRVTSLGDWLKAASPASRVYAVSGKDRGAITLNGKTGDGAFWYVADYGFTTFAAPGEDLAAKAAPMAAHNQAVARGLEIAPPGWTYEHEECRALESEWTINGATFRSALPPQRFAIENSPVLDELTLQAAETLLAEQRLGRRGVTDMLGVSLSATDRIGHGYGTQGPEMCEQMHRLDAALGDFFEQLDQIPGQVLVVLTADHGGADFPERTAARGHEEARRGDPRMLPRINEALKARFGLDENPLVSDGMIYVVGDGRIAPDEPRKREVAAAALELIRAEPTVAGAWTRAELLAMPMPPADRSPQEVTLAERFRLSVADGRGGDIMLALQPGITPSQGRVGGAISGHGTPWDNDRRVPILFWWKGAAAQERFLPIRTVDIAPTLARVIGVTPPETLDGRCLSLGVPGAKACEPQQ